MEVVLDTDDVDVIVVAVVDSLLKVSWHLGLLSYLTSDFAGVTTNARRAAEAVSQAPAIDQAAHARGSSHVVKGQIG
jgi:hypothetical protein